MINVASGATFEAVAETGTAGLVGTISLRIDDNDGNIVSGPSIASIIELSSTGIYSAERTAPVALGQYTLIWSTDGSFDPDSVLIEDLLVSEAASVGALPPIAAPEEGGLVAGPCTAWITEEEVAECHAEIGTDLTPLESPVSSASQLLFERSGRLFSGLCEKTVRPCGQSSCFPWPQVLEGSGYVVWPYSWRSDGWWGDSGRWCGCSALSRVRLPGYPVREVLEVLIDGVAIDASGYRLDEHQWLVRLRDADGEQQYWPSCQNLDEAQTEVGTWAVRYQYGQSPPQAGKDAAAELAWQIYLACSDNAAQCKLPRGTQRISRNGVSIDIKAFTAWGHTSEGWKTGLPLVDLFLNTYNPHGIRRRAAIISPDVTPYAYEVG